MNKNKSTVEENWLRLFIILERSSKTQDKVLKQLAVMAAQNQDFFEKSSDSRSLLLTVLRFVQKALYCDEVLISFKVFNKEEEKRDQINLRQQDLQEIGANGSGYNEDCDYK